MNKSFYGDFKLGILGGGQLGRMLIQEGINFNLSTAVLDPDASAPCRDLTNEFFQGDLGNYETVYAFGKRVDLLTIEIEHINVDALLKLEEEGSVIYPQPAILKLIQDKGLQKEFYKKNNIPTASYFLVENKAEILQYSSEFPFMQKLRKGGYDGKGVIKIQDKNDLAGAFDAPSVLEKLIDFEKEVSVIVARNASGEINHFPAVELEFNPEANLVEFLFSPAAIAPDIEKKAVEIARMVAEKLGIIGILAVEMFITKDGNVLVNEIAPRPHNSGHQTIEGNLTSQYEQHLRCILNLPLGSTKITMPSVMVNLLGEKGYTGPARFQGLNEVMEMEGIYIHLYGKKTTKPFRKMGHVTVLAEDIPSAKRKAMAVKQKLKVTC